MAGLDSLLTRTSPTKLERFSTNPYKFLAESIYSVRQHQLSHDSLSHRTPSTSPIQVVCLSDTHNQNHNIQVPDGDLLIHAGDLTNNGTVAELQAAIEWLNSLPHLHKVVVAGNHELCLDKDSPTVDHPTSIDWGDVHYLQNSSITLDFSDGLFAEKLHSLKIYGSPKTPKQGNWAFMYARNTDMWSNTLPSDTDVLVTHGPPRHHLDDTCGCRYLLKETWRVQPKLHIFGHIHAARGQEVVAWDGAQMAYELLCSGVGGWRDLLKLTWAIIFPSCVAIRRTTLVNAAMVKGRKNEGIHPAIVVEL